MTSLPPAPQFPDEGGRRGDPLREALYRLLADSPFDAVWTLGPDGRIAHVSPSIEPLLGYSADEVRGMEADQLLTPESAAETSAYFYAVIADLKAGRTPEPFRQDCEWRHKDGTTVFSEVLAYPSVDSEGRLVGISGVARDLSHRRRLEAERSSAQRMESMGRMAAGIAHEVNNAMTIIQAATELLADESVDSEEARRRRTEVFEAVERVNGLTSHLLWFSRHQHIVSETMRLGDLVAAARLLLDREAPSAEPVVGPKDDAADALLLADRRQVEQVLLQLAANARDAVVNGGQIDVRCATTTLVEPLPTRTVRLPAGAYVTLVVEDTGVGMTAEVLEHIFEPFYTTKGHGQGAGLGLATVFGILQQNEAGVTVESTPGSGTRVTVYWPMRGRAAVAESASVTGAPVAWTVARTAARTTVGAVPLLLVVDDEPTLLLLMTKMLKRLGYRTLTAGDGLEALAVARERRDEITAIITDVRMPRMTGTEFISALISEGIDLPALIISGQLDAPMPTDWPAGAPRRFLAKPFEIEQLRAEVAQLGVAPV